MNVIEREHAVFAQCAVFRNQIPTERVTVFVVHVLFEIDADVRALVVFAQRDGLRRNAAAELREIIHPFAAVRVRLEVVNARNLVGRTVRRDHIYGTGIDDGVDDIELLHDDARYGVDLHLRRRPAVARRTRVRIAVRNVARGDIYLAVHRVVKHDCVIAPEVRVAVAAFQRELDNAGLTRFPEQNAAGRRRARREADCKRVVVRFFERRRQNFVRRLFFAPLGPISVVHAGVVVVRRMLNDVRRDILGEARRSEIILFFVVFRALGRNGVFVDDRNNLPVFDLRLFAHREFDIAVCERISVNGRIVRFGYRNAIARNIAERARHLFRHGGTKIIECVLIGVVNQTVLFARVIGIGLRESAVFVNDFRNRGKRFAFEIFHLIRIRGFECRAERGARVVIGNVIVFDGGTERADIVFDTDIAFGSVKTHGLALHHGSVCIPRLRTLGFHVAVFKVLITVSVHLERVAQRRAELLCIAVHFFQTRKFVGNEVCRRVVRVIGKVRPLAASAIVPRVGNAVAVAEILPGVPFFSFYDRERITDVVTIFFITVIRVCKRLIERFVRRADVLSDRAVRRADVTRIGGIDVDFRSFRRNVLTRNLGHAAVYRLHIAAREVLIGGIPPPFGVLDTEHIARRRA